jgi:hypothetical protein
MVRCAMGANALFQRPLNERQPIGFTVFVERSFELAAKIENQRPTCGTIDSRWPPPRRAGTQGHESACQVMFRFFDVSAWSEVEGTARGWDGRFRHAR